VSALADLPGSALAIGCAERTDFAAVRALLAVNGLPVEGVEAGALSLIVARDAAGNVHGAAGCEALGMQAGLLRSVVVAESARGRGLGHALVEAVEAAASAEGCAELWLLTTTAADFFARLGYRVTAREQAPAALRATREFSLLCPDSAILMRKTLAESGAIDDWASMVQA